VSFFKTAQVQSLGAYGWGVDGIIKRAGPETGSFYLSDGARKLPFGDILAKVAAQYAISEDPRDYLLEAIRANTTNIPNENNDGFHQSELLRYDVRIGMPVYRTYEEKPHHVDHRTENPKAARGLIIDAHYFDETPPLDECPRCANKTAQRQNRDQSGLHCRRCGQVVKDEFVEILLGVDTKKDPTFARGVQAGHLPAGSMGCNCLNTTCNVCGHIAYSRPEFCEHIRAGNKGTLWQKRGSIWQKVDPIFVKREAKRRGYNFDPVDFCYLIAEDGFEVRKAFEFCENVIFDEYSRVRQPADPKALSREILKAAGAKTASAPWIMVPDNLHAPGHNPTPDELRRESELLIQSMLKTAAAAEGNGMKYTVIRVNGDDADIHAAETLEAAMEAAGASDGDTIEKMEVEANDPLEACDLFNAEECEPVTDKEAVEAVEVPAGETLVVETAPGGPPGGAPPPQQSIEEKQQEMAPGMPPPGPGPAPGPAPERSMSDLGLMPGASASSLPHQTAKRRRRSAARRRPPMRFAETYKHWEVEVTPQGNARIFNAKKEPILVVRGKPNLNANQRYEWGRKVLSSLYNDGLIPTASKMQGIFTRTSQVVDHAIDDMKEFADKYMHNSVREDADDDMQPERDKPPAKVPDDASDDMEGNMRGTPPSSTGEDGAVDHAEGKPDKGDDPVAEDNTDMREKRDKITVGSDSALDNETHDHTERLATLTRVGKKVAHKNRPKTPWVVVGTKLSTGQVEKSKFGDVSVYVQAGKERRRIGQKDLLEYWFSLDRQPPKRTAESEDDKPCVEVEPEVEIEVEAKKKIAAYEKRSKKAWAKREAALKAEHDREIEMVKAAAIESFCRSLRIVAARQGSNLEQSPLKLAAEKVLGVPRPIGKDAATGADIQYNGMDPELVRYLVAEVYQVGHHDHLENLMRRAADLTSRGDQYLLDAEADIQNFQAPLPQISASHVAQPIDEAALRAHQMRQAAAGGNFVVNSGPPPEDGQFGEAGQPMGKRGAIRGAVSGTLVGSTLDQFHRAAS
jgi:hypothetical protein